jgi:hypothetical protein
MTSRGRGIGVIALVVTTIVGLLVACAPGNESVPDQWTDDLRDETWRNINTGNLHGRLSREPPRELWRLQALRGWSHDTTWEVSAGGS